MADDPRTTEMEGRAKEAGGAATGDDEARREGRAEQRKGKMQEAKERMRDAADAARDAFRK